MDYRDLINRVLRRMREDTIDSDWSGDLQDDTSVTDDYQKLIGDFVNEAKVEVEDAWNWTQLRSTEDVTTSNGTTTYTMPNHTDRSRILYVFDDTNDNKLMQISDAQFENYQFIGTTQVGIPAYYRLIGNDISFWPTPAGTYDIKITTVIPQAELSDATTELTVPDQPVILKAYALAIEERGEDGGTTGDKAELKADKALSDAISQDSLRTVDETVWHAS